MLHTRREVIAPQIGQGDRLAVSRRENCARYMPYLFILFVVDLGTYRRDSLAFNDQARKSLCCLIVATVMYLGYGLLPEVAALGIAHCPLQPCFEQNDCIIHIYTILGQAGFDAQKI